MWSEWCWTPQTPGGPRMSLFHSAAENGTWTRPQPNSAAPRAARFWSVTKFTMNATIPYGSLFTFCLFCSVEDKLCERMKRQYLKLATAKTLTGWQRGGKVKGQTNEGGIKRTPKRDICFTPTYIHTSHSTGLSSAGD